MAKIQFEVIVDLGADEQEEMNSLAAALCLFLAPRTHGFKGLTSRIIDGQRTKTELSTLPHNR